jgi:predicted ATPase
MGTTMFYRGDQPRAREHLDRVEHQYRRSLGRAQAFWFGYNLSDFAQSHLARVLCLQGYLDQARDLAQNCIDQTRMASQKLGLCYSLVEAACPIALMLDDLDAAERHVALLVSTAATVDLSYWKNQARCLEGVLLVTQGNNDAGAAALRAALADCDECGGISGYPGYLGTLAKALSTLGQLPEARTTLDQALMRADSDGEEWCIPDLLCTKGELALQESARSFANEAEDCFNRALATARQQGALLWQLQSALHLARLRVGYGRPDDARQILAPVYRQFVEGFETADLRAAKMLLGSLPTDRST